MALTYLILFPAPYLKPNDPVYWFMMQIGLVIVYFTSFPMNRLVVEWDAKEGIR